MNEMSGILSVNYQFPELHAELIRIYIGYPYKNCGRLIYNSQKPFCGVGTNSINKPYPPLIDFLNASVKANFCLPKKFFALKSEYLLTL